MKKIYLSAALVLLFFITALKAQVGIGIATPDASAMLDISSTNKGLLVPRITLTGTGDNTTIVSPQTSLLVYNTATAGSGTKAVTPGYYYWNGSAWERLGAAGSSSASAWSLKGNAGTNPAVNFIGTTDAKPLVVKVNNQLAGKLYSEDHNTSWGYLALLNNTGSYNTAIGREALGLNTSGTNNTASGYAALYKNTTGSYNTANGNWSLYSNTTGSNNTAIGDSALFNNTTGNFNTAIGRNALALNTTGGYNTANGTEALYHNTLGYFNTAYGYDALYNNDEDFNTAYGYNALYSNTKGFYNTANGIDALYSNTIGKWNTANGAKALYNNTSGYTNTANGFYSLYSNTTGNNNTANGHRSLLYNTTGNYNIANGDSALFKNTTGSNNTADGHVALKSNTRGSYNTALGSGADVASNNLTNATAIGAGAIVNASNKVRIGNAAVTAIEGAVTFTPSDGRLKFNVQEDVHGLDFIMKLRPITYQFDAKKMEEQMTGKPVRNSAAIQASYREATAIRHTGFIAQEVEKAAAEIGYDFTGVNKPVSDKDHYSLSYESFIMPLVKAVQEQQEQVDKLVKENKVLKETIAKMQAAFAAQEELLAQQLKEVQAAITKQETKEQSSASK